ncbi:MAG TPA: S24 family peptidase, partial [Ferruginibacter sp.]|nr:S24 family peptidase [Ferruginibacter sp.]HMP20929.1 S24 family peptidase [Ferruginibacter sp.]
FENVHLNEKNKDSKFQKNVHPNVHPNVHLSGVKTPKTHAINSLIVAEDEANYEVKSRGNVYDFDSQAAAGMAMYLSQKDKLIQVPTLNLPGLGPGLHIRCQVSGDSMHGTIKDGDHVIATQLKSPADELREGFIHVVFDKDDGIVCKRLYKADKHHLELVSDNDIYTPYKRHLNDLLFIFKVVEVHTRDLRNYFNDTRREVSKLWKAIEDINARLPKLK